jgi:hypothetical protein
MQSLFHDLPSVLLGEYNRNSEVPAFQQVGHPCGPGGWDQAPDLYMSYRFSS